MNKAVQVGFGRAMRARVATRLVASLAAGALAMACSASDESEPSVPAVSGPVPNSALPVAPNPSNVFTNITAWAGLEFDLSGEGAAFVDVDGDGFDDVVIASWTRTVVFRNRGDGSFYPLWQTTYDHDIVYPYALDTNADGVQELLLAGTRSAALWRGFPNGGFSEMAGAVPAPAPGLDHGIATFGDFDRDGRLDLFLGAMNTTGDDPDAFGVDSCDPADWQEQILDLPAAPDRLVMSGSDGFREATPAAVAAARYTQAAMVVDLNDDGHLDLLVGTEGVRPDVVLLGDGAGGFSDQTEALGITAPSSAMGFDAVDIDEDGDLDLYVTDEVAEGDKLYLQNEDGTFTLATAERGLGVTSTVTGWGLGFFDFDNDSDLDLFVANGLPLGDNCPGGSQVNLLMKNDGTGHFTAWETPAGSGLDVVANSRAVAFSDIDNDGDIDILVANTDAPPTLLRNDVATGHWLQLVLRHPVMSPPVGARVTLKLGERTLRRDVKGTASYGGSSSNVIHIGLGDATEAQEVMVRWPDGTTTELGTLAADQRLVVTP